MSQPIRERIRHALKGEDPKFGEVLLWVIYTAIAMSIVTMTLQSMMIIPEWIREWLFVLNMALAVLFTLEYATRVWSAEKPLQYVFSFWGLIDLLAILPMVMFLWQDSAALRLLRLFRALRLLKMGRMNAALDRLGRAVASIKEDLILFTILSGMMLYFAALGIYHLERNAQPETFGSIPDAIWWAIVTLTTVGYGDATPITTGGRIFTGFVLLIGLGIVAIPAGLITAALLNTPKITSSPTTTKADKAKDTPQPDIQGDPS